MNLEMGSVQRARTAIGVIAILVGIFGLLALFGIMFQSGPLQTPG